MTDDKGTLKPDWPVCNIRQWEKLILRILLVLEAFNALGGIAEIVDAIAGQLVRLGHQVFIASTFDRQAREQGHERVASGAAECIYVDIWNRKPLSMRHLEALWRIPLHNRWTGFARELRRIAPD